MNRLRKRQGQIEWLLLIFVLAVALFFVWRYVDYTVNSDDASELVLCRLLADEGRLLSRNWFYSTELVVFTSNIIFTPFFKLFDDWHTVRFIGTLIQIFIMLASFYCYCAATDNRRSFALSAVLLLLPLNELMFRYTVKIAYYANIYALGFLIAAALFVSDKAKGRGSRISAVAIGSVLSLLAGLGGFRLVLTCHVTLVLTAFLFIWSIDPKKWEGWSRHKPLVYTLLCFCLAAGVGLILNLGPLSESYSYQDFSVIMTKSFKLDGLQRVLSGMIEGMGYRKGAPLLGIAIAFCTVGVTLFLMSLHCSVGIIRRKGEFTEAQLFAAWFYLASVLTLCLVYTFTDLEYFESYCFTAIVLAFVPIISFFLGGRSKGKAGRRIVLATLMLALLCSAVSFNELRKRDNNKPYREIVSFLTENGYRDGYATFWNANVLTELSDGEIDVWAWFQRQVQLDEPSTLRPWLQKKEHFERPPEGKLFVLISSTDSAPVGNRFDAYSYWDFMDILGKENLVFETERYLDALMTRYAVYGFDSYNALLEQLNQG